MSVLISPTPSHPSLHPGLDIKVSRQHRAEPRCTHAEFNLCGSGQLQDHLRDGMTKAEMIKEEAAIQNNLLSLWERQCILLKSCT